jgi:hypothetical protein
VEQRDGFYFHRSFWDSLQLMTAKDQVAILRAVCEFALDGKEPEKLTGTQRASWVLIRPILEKGRNKAENGKQGGSKKQANRKQTGSKPEANQNQDMIYLPKIEKQTDSKSENASCLLLSDNNSDSESDKGVILTNYDKGQGSNSYELRQGIKDSASVSADGAFESFWRAYPESNRGDAAAAKTAWDALKMSETDKKALLMNLDRWKRSDRWLSDGGKFIPNAVNYLNPTRGYIKGTPPAPSQGRTQTIYGCSESGPLDREIIKRMLEEE